ncbi:hypothetical protein BDW22DRAFT_1483967 [Trametopsis cervina]|nr:hypothetical protein BDW22DRAFT_1483967 [Trametopsis cervina]
MPVTRRQSGKLPASVRKDCDDKPLDLTEEYSFSDELSELTDSDSNNDMPIAKRRKPSTKSPKKTTARSKRSSTRNVFDGLPLDILHEILRLVPPADLINFACISKGFWTTLSSLHSQGIWRASRVNTMLFKKIEIPDPPSHVSERRWAYLLFGQPRCFTCNAPRIHNIAFQLLRRACTACMKKNLVWSNKFSSVFDGYDEKILDFIPYTNVGGSAHGHSSTSRFYWKADVDAIARQHGDLVKNVRMRKPGAPNQPALFEGNRVKVVLEMTELPLKMKIWAENVQKQKVVAAQEDRAERSKEVVSRLTRMGWNPDEIQDATVYDVEKTIHRPKSLTDRSWKLLLAKLEVIRDEGIERREAARIQTLKQLLRESFLAAYRHWKSSLPPLQWALLPGEAEIWGLPETLATRELATTASSIQLDDSLLAGWASQLPTMTARWVEQRKERIVSLIPSPTSTTDASTALSLVLKEPSTNVDSVCVFTCSNLLCQYTHRLFGRPEQYLPLVGVDEAVAHWCHASMKTHHCRDATDLVFSSRGSEAFAALVHAANMHVDTKTVSEMDAAGMSFVCMSCPIHHEQGCSGRNVMGWRQCILHYTMSTHNEPEWQLVHQDNAPQIVLLNNQPNPYQWCRNGWACMRCPEHISKQLERPAVEEHLQTRHNIAAGDAQVGVDLFWLAIYPRPDLPSRILAMGEQLPVP